MAIKSFAGVVAVLDQNSTQVFPKAEMMRATVREVSRPMEHPIETGATITDHRIILPVEINLAIIVEAVNVKDVYNQIRQLYLDGTFLVVQTRSASYSNQFIVALPHDEAPDKSGVIVIGLRLKQAQIAKSQSQQVEVQPSDPANDSTVDAGIKQPAEPKAPTTASSLIGFGA